MESEIIFMDTGAWFAFYDKKDSAHLRVKNVVTSRSDEIVTSNYVLDELVTLFKARHITVNQFRDFVEDLWNEEICGLLRVTETIDREAWDMIKKYHDQEFSFTDCTSFVLMKRHQIKKVCALDHHFQIAGFQVIV